MTINLNQCRVLLCLTPEQFEQLLEAARDGRAIVVEGEEAPAPTHPGIVKSAPASNVVELRRAG